MTVVRRGAQTRVCRSTTPTATRRQRTGRQQQQHPRRRARVADMGAPRALTTAYGGAPPQTRSSRLGRTTRTAWRGLAAHANSSSSAAVDAALNALSGTGGAAQPGGARSAAQDEARSSRLGHTMSTDLSPLAARTSGGAAAEVKRHGAAWPRTPTRAAARWWMPR